jgi:hypothetical protein
LLCLLLCLLRACWHAGAGTQALEQGYGGVQGTGVAEVPVHVLFIPCSTSPAAVRGGLLLGRSWRQAMPVAALVNEQHS